MGEKVINAKPEYEDLKRVARELNLPLREVAKRWKNTHIFLSASSAASITGGVVGAEVKSGCVPI